MRYAVIDFYNDAEYNEDTWFIPETDFYKYMGTDNPTLEDLNQLAEDTIKYSVDDDYNCFNAYFE
jgi:hypothetical protein